MIRTALVTGGTSGIGLGVSAALLDAGSRQLRCTGTDPHRHERDRHRRLGPAGMLAQVPVGRWGSPGEMAHFVLALLSPAAAFSTGTVIAVDGGYLAH